MKQINQVVQDPAVINATGDEGDCAHTHHGRGTGPLSVSEALQLPWRPMTNQPSDAADQVAGWRQTRGHAGDTWLPMTL
jgi:hypothetical protein